MTRKEIEKAAQRCVALGSEPDGYPTAEDVTEEMATLVLQAYEECAQKLDEHVVECQRTCADSEEDDTVVGRGLYWRADGASDALEKIAVDIRALADSLKGEKG